MGRSELHSIPKQTIYNDKLYVASNDNRQQTAKTVKAHIVPNANIPRKTSLAPIILKDRKRIIPNAIGAIA